MGDIFCAIVRLFDDNPLLFNRPFPLWRTMIYLLLQVRHLRLKTLNADHELRNQLGLSFIICSFVGLTFYLSHLIFMLLLNQHGFNFCVFDSLMTVDLLQLSILLVDAIEFLKERVLNRRQLLRDHQLGFFHLSNFFLITYILLIFH